MRGVHHRVHLFYNGNLNAVNVLMYIFCTMYTSQKLCAQVENSLVTDKKYLSYNHPVTLYKALLYFKKTLQVLS